MESSSFVLSSKGESAIDFQTAMAGNVLAANAAAQPINTSRLVNLAMLSSSSTLLRLHFCRCSGPTCSNCNLKARPKLLRLVEITKQEAEAWFANSRNSQEMKKWKPLGGILLREWTLRKSVQQRVLTTRQESIRFWQYDCFVTYVIHLVLN